jgi:tetratricopeptide (TPR) repeat protein
MIVFVFAFLKDDAMNDLRAQFVRLTVVTIILICIVAIGRLSPALSAQVLTPDGCSAKITSGSAEKTFLQSPEAQKFKFTQIDLDLLKQADASDQELEDKGLILHDHLADEYIQRIGCSVTSPYSIEKVKWRFRVVRNPGVNAFAKPNGSIFILSGLLSRLENEAQLAGILAHEVTHVMNRHGYLQNRNARKKQTAMTVIRSAIEDAGLTAAAMVGPIYVLASQSGMIPSAIISSGAFRYSRKLERESDIYAVRIINSAGYDPEQASKALVSIKKGPEVDLSREPRVWATHPKVEQRVKYTGQLAAELNSENGGKINASSYLSATRNAVFHDAHLAMMLGRPRTALAVAKRLIDSDSQNAEYYTLLGDSFRALGARSPEPTQEEQTKKAKKNARRLLGKSTPQEYEQALMNAPGGKERWEINCRLSEQAFTRALEIDPRNTGAFLGLGLLFESESRFADAMANFRVFLEIAPGSLDARRIRQRLDSLQKKILGKTTAEVNR